MPEYLIDKRSIFNLDVVKVFDKLKDNATWEKIPIIFLAARTDKIAVNAGEFLGNDFIEKPFDTKDLKSRIDKVLKDTNQK